MKAKVIVDIAKESDAQAVIKTNNAIVGLTGNANFTTPIIPLVDMTNDNDDLIDKIAKAHHGGTAETLAKNQAREIVNSNYRAEGNYVNSICKGDPTKAESSGFDLCQPKAHYLPPDLEAVNLKIHGAIAVFSRAKPNGLIARFIQYTQTPSESASWLFGGLTRKQRKVIVNLPVGVRIWIRVAVVVNEDFLDWSDPFSIVVT
jgi:hypothetical protein